jgi:hypothetical protein
VVQPPQAWVIAQVDADEGNGARNLQSTAPDNFSLATTWFFKLGDAATVMSFL